MRRRTWGALGLSGLLALLLTPVGVGAQSVVTAQILDFWRLLSIGGTFSGTTLAFQNLTLISNGYETFGTTAGVNGYGLRDNAGTIQIKNQNGTWTTPAGGADPLGTYLIQTADAGLPNAQVMGSLGTGLVISTTTTGVASIFGGTSCTHQFPRSLSASGAATCASVDFANDMTGTLLATNFPALTGDVTTAGGALATTLATVNSNVGSFGTTAKIPSITVNGKGLITAISDAAPQLTLSSTYFSSLSAANLTGIPGANVTGTLATVAFPALTGDVTSAGSSLATVVGKVGGVAISLAGSFTTSGANTLTFTTTANTSVTLPTSGTLVNSAVATLSSLTSIGTIGTGVWQGTPVVPQYGGTGLATITAHAVMVGEATSTVVPVAGCTNGVLDWTASSSDPSCTGTPLVTSIGLTGSEILGGTGAAAAATTRVSITKSITGMTDATTTPVFTITVPNAAESAVVKVVFDGSLGAGGAVGAFECSATLTGAVAVTRTSGLATVGTAASASSTASSCVVGATTITLAYAVSSNTGANNAQQTFTINATITKGGGASANHTLIASGEVLNSQASGITIS